MDRLIARNTVAFGSHDTVPTTGTPQMATDGNPLVPIPATIWPAYAWNMLSEEQRNVLLAAGITPDGSNWTQLAQAAQILGKRLQTYTTPGTYSWTVLAGVYRVRFRVTGGGGGGGGGSSTTGLNYAGSGGGGGGWLEWTAPVVPGDAYTIIVGAGGAGGAALSPGASGGATSVSGPAGTVSAGGGQYGQYQSNSATYQSAGGSASGGSVNMAGGAGGLVIGGPSSNGIGGPGGNAPRGGQGGVASFDLPSPGIAPGGGGGGAGGPAGRSGGAGGAGMVEIWY